MKKHLLRPLLALSLLPPASACAIIPDTPLVEGPVAQAEGTPVAIGQPVWVGRLVATPIKVEEDSRCPMNARCAWAGQLIVSTRIDGPGWRETMPLTLGKVHDTHGTAIMLASGTPDRMAGEQGPDQATRFTYEGGR